MCEICETETKHPESQKTDFIKLIPFPFLEIHKESITHNPMTNSPFKKYFELEQRMLRFARNIRTFVRKLPKSVSNAEDSKQLIKSSGSVGANYIEANESFSKKDFMLRIRISKKESKESSFWLDLVDTQGFDFLEKERKVHAKECDELTKILGSILAKCKTKSLSF